MEEIQKQLKNSKIQDHTDSSDAIESFNSLNYQKESENKLQEDIHYTEKYAAAHEEKYKNLYKYSAEYCQNLLKFPINNIALLSLKLPEEALHIQKLSNITKLQEPSVFFHKTSSKEKLRMDIYSHPPSYITHSSYNIFHSRILNARTLTRPGALKEVIHFDLDVTDYPLDKNENWIVGSSIGICIPNLKSVVDEIFELLNISREEADEKIILETNNSIWPIISNNGHPQKIETTRRDVITWIVDVQSIPPKKSLLRVLAEYAKDPLDKKLLLFLCSKEGQKSFFNIRSQNFITLSHLLHAFPSSKPPLEHLLSVLPSLNPRYYSLSNDPSLSPGVLQIAFTIIQMPHWRGEIRPGVASAYLKQIFNTYIDMKNLDTSKLSELTIPIFKRNHQNPFAHDAYAPGPRIFIGVGVGIAPFRGFVQNRLQNISYLKETWVIQGCRNAELDEIYSGEWGLLNASMNRIVVESRARKKEHVQDEVRRKGKLIWEIINSENGRIYICGPNTSFIKSLDECFIEIAMEQEGYNREDAIKKWEEFKNPLILKYIKEIW